MSTPWPVLPLRDLCDDFKKDIVDGPFGSNLKRAHYTNDGVPVLKIQNIKPFEIKLHKMDYVSEKKAEELKRHSFQKGDIIMTKLGDPLGVSAVVEDLDKGIIVADLVRIRAQKIDTKFLCYQLNSPTIKAHINSLQKGTTRPRVRITIVRDIPIIVPPIEEQQRIVSILDEVFEKIGESIESTENEFNAASDLLESQINNIFSNPVDSSRNTLLGNVCKLRNGRAYKKTELLDEGKYRVLRVGNFFTNKHWYYSDLELDDTKFCETGDLLYAWSASFGPRIWEGERSIFHYHIWRVDYNEQILNKKYLYYWFLWDAEKIKSEQGTGTTMVHVSMKSMNAREISIPSLEQQQQIVRELDVMVQQISELIEISQNKLQNYLSLKQSILQEAFNGNL